MNLCNFYEIEPLLAICRRLRSQTLVTCGYLCTRYEFHGNQKQSYALTTIMQVCEEGIIFVFNFYQKILKFLDTKKDFFF